MLTNPYGSPRTGSHEKKRHACANRSLSIITLIFISLFSHAQYISTVAGNGTAGYSGDGGAATSAELKLPFALTLDAAGNIYIADYTNERIRMVTAASGIIRTIAGTGTAGYNGDGITATSATINLPEGIAVDPSGNIYISDYNNKRIRKITASTGLISTIAGTGTQGYSGDGAAATAAKINAAQGIALDASGNVYIADAGNNRIRKITVSTGIITTIAGIGTAGFSGDGAAATLAKLNYPSGVALDAAGNIYIADNSNNRIRKVTLSTGKITTIAGTGTASYSGDGGAATSATIKYPQEVALDPAGNLYISDVGNSRVREVSIATGIITTVVGTGIPGYNGDGTIATLAEVYAPDGIAFDASGSMYIADGQNNRIRKVINKSALPITLVSFGASAGPDQTVDLRWLTASETNSCYYDIERSIDAVNFVVIGMISAAGNSDVSSNYTFTDHEPLPGVSYYRLHEVDCDGRYTYSEIVDFTTRPSDGIRFSVYPNPAKNMLHIESTVTGGNILIANLLGEVVYSAHLDGSGVIHFDLPAGSYLMELHTSSGVAIKRILVE